MNLVKNIRIFYKKHSSFATACSEKNSKLNDNRLEEQQSNMTNILLEQRNWKRFKLNFHIQSFMSSPL